MIRNSYPTLDFGLGDTADMLRDAVRSFSDDKIAPVADEIDRSNEFHGQLWSELGALRTETTSRSTAICPNCFPASMSARWR
jgi:hypothetical protein